MGLACHADAKVLLHLPAVGLSSERRQACPTIPMNKLIAPVIASIATLLLSGCYVSEVSYTRAYYRPAHYGRPYYHDGEPYRHREPYYGRSSYYSRAPYPYSSQSRYYAPSRYQPTYRHRSHDHDDYDDYRDR